MTAFYQLILRNNLLGMSNLSEFIQQLKSNQEAFNSKLAKVEDLGNKVSKSVLRDLIQDARELHEGTVVLSYILFNEEEASSGEQLEMPLEDKLEPQLEVQESVEEEFEEGQGFTEEEELLDALDEALEYTQKEIQTDNMVSEIASEIQEVESEIEEEVVAEEEVIEQPEAVEPVFEEPIEAPQDSVEEEVPSQEELTASLESEISSVISMHSSIPTSVAEEVEEDNSLAAKLARQKIENLSSAIGINEKFLFTNELFDGNTEQFLQTIDDLNNCGSLSEAKDKLTAVAQKRSWEVEEEPYQKLESLLSRKYQ